MSWLLDVNTLLASRRGKHNPSAKVLLETLEEQLVQKCMASETSMSGCLLITLSRDRTWDHPHGGARIDFPELIALLRSEADRIVEKYGRSLRLHVNAFDLQPRLSREKYRRRR